MLPLLAVIAYSEWTARQARRVEIHEEALRSVTFAASEVQRIFDGIENLLVALLQGPFVAERDPNGCRAYIERLHPKVPHLRAIGVADTRGDAWCGTGAGLSIADRIYFKDALTTPDTLFIGHYAVGRASGAKVIPFGLKLSGSDAVAYGSLDLIWLSEKLLQRGVPSGGSITVSDREGKMIARQPFPERFIGSQIPEPFMRLVKGDAPGTEQVMSQDGTARVLGYIPAKVEPVRNLYLSVGLSYEASYGNVERMARIAAVIAASSACLALLAAWLMGNRMVVKPLSSIAGTASRWRSGDNSARTGLNDASEFGVVGANLDRMMDELQRNQEQRELLSRELEHRVKNMLTTVQAIAGMSFAQNTSQSDLQIFLNRLRALGLGYSAIRADHWEAAPLSEVVERALEPLGGRANERLSIAGPPANLSSRQVLAISMVLHELGTNAVKYGALSTAGGRVSVHWTLEGDQLRLTWMESGGPTVVSPSKHGFGTRLIHAFGSELGHADLQYDSAGATCVIVTTVVI